MSDHTLAEIARRIGVSASTVSRVVNDCGNVKPETRDKVLAAMEVYHYIPNLVARNLKMSRCNAIGLIVPDINDPYFANITKSLEACLSAMGYNMILCITNEDGEKESKYLGFMMQNMIDGVVIATVADRWEAHQRYLDSGRAMVFIDNLPAMPCEHRAVITDNEAASRLAVEHLVDLGHRNIAIIAGKQTETTGVERLNGYLAAMKEHNITVEPGWVRYGDFKGESGYENMMLLLREQPEITAAYSNSSQMTYGACKALLDVGRAMPANFSLVGFDIHNNTGMLESNITSVVQQEEKIGRYACDLLMDAMRAENGSAQKHVRIQPKLIVRQSTCARR